MNDATTQNGGSKKPAIFYWILDILQIAVMVLIVLGGFWAAKKIIASVERPKRRKRPKMTAVVEIKELQAGRKRISIQAMGTVIPAREVDLQIQVSGRVIEIHPNLIEGATLPANAEAVKIESEDYDIALTHAQLQLKKAEADLALEQGQHEVAKQEWEMLQKETEAKNRNDLALRIPQLNKARAAVESAKNDVAQAKLNQSRTTVVVPFNALVRTKNIDIGSQVSPSAKLASLIGTDEFWIKVTIPVERLPRIVIPGLNGDTGSQVTVHYGSNGEAECQGTVLRLLSDLEPGGRMAQLLITVKDPLNTKNKKLPLLLNSYVRVTIQGAELDRVFEVPRAALRENNKVWLLDPGWKLDIRDVKIAWRTSDTVLVSEGLKAGEKLILSNIPTPVPGMPAVTADEMRRRQKEKAAEGTPDKPVDSEGPQSDKAGRKSGKPTQ